MNRQIIAIFLYAGTLYRIKNCSINYLKFESVEFISQIVSKIGSRAANNVHSNQIALKEQSDQDSHCLLQIYGVIMVKNAIKLLGWCKSALNMA